MTSAEIDIDALFDSVDLTDVLVGELGFDAESLVKLLTTRPDLVELLKQEIAISSVPSGEEELDRELLEECSGGSCCLATIRLEKPSDGTD